MREPITPSWETEELLAIFFRLLQIGWTHPGYMSDRMAEQYGMSLGHYGRLALAEIDAKRERHANMHPLMRDLVNMTAEIYGVPAPETKR